MKKYLITGLVVLLVTIGAGVWLSAAPTVGVASASPAYVVINTPTSVLITASITDATVISTGVNLLKTDATGKTLATIGLMRDDGTNGDLKANDKVFTYRLTVNQPTIGQHFYRVSAPFRGVLARALSNVVAVTIDPFQLPPDPGEAGNQTLEGIDSDGDGVRDDVQRYIAVSYTDADLRLAVRQLSRANQLIIAEHDADADAIYELVLRRHAAQHCLYFRNEGDISKAAEQRIALRAVLLNTAERSRAFLTADAKLGGRVFSNSDPATWATDCESQ